MRGGVFSAAMGLATFGMVGVVEAATVYVTGDTTTIRRSVDGAAFTTFGPAAVAGQQFRGIDVNPTTGTVYVNDRNGGGGTTNRPLYSLSSAGTVVDQLSFVQNGSGGVFPVAFDEANGRVYQHTTQFTGNNSTTGFVGTSGDTLTADTLTPAGTPSWAFADGDFASNGTNSYLYYNGGSGLPLNRSIVNADGTLGARVGLTVSARTDKTNGNAAVDLTGINFTDLAITGSGRFLVLGQSTTGGGLYLSDSNLYTSGTVALDKIFSFSAAETGANGDMGPNARDFKLLGDELFAVTNTRLYQYGFNDSTGEITAAAGSMLHGFNSGNVQMSGLVAVPEPTSLAVLGLAGLLGLRRRRAM